MKRKIFGGERKGVSEKCDCAGFGVCFWKRGFFWALCRKGVVFRCQLHLTL